MCVCDSSDPYDSISIKCNIYDERKCLERALPVPSYTAPNLPRKKGSIMKGQIKKNIMTADLRKSNKKLSSTEKFSLFWICKDTEA
jgi:hypothetical protein